MDAPFLDPIPSDEPLLEHPDFAGAALVEETPASKERKAKRILMFCTSLQFLIYADRGIIAGLLTLAEAEFRINKVKSGLLGTIFLAGFMLMSPVAASMANSGKSANSGRSSWRVTGWGLLVWIAALAGCALAPNYGTLLLCRAMAGCGEAAVCSLAPPLIDDSAPEGRKSAYLAIYFSAIFVGLGVGFAIAGFVTSWSDGQHLFFGEVALMAPLCATSLFCNSALCVAKAPEPPVVRRGPSWGTSTGGTLRSEADVPRLSRPGSFEDCVGSKPGRRLSSRSNSGVEGLAGAGMARNAAAGFSLEALKPVGEKREGQLPRKMSFQETVPTIFSNVMGVLRSAVYTLLVLGYCPTIFTIGGIAFWAPSYMSEVVGAAAGPANQILGAITILTGLFGTSLGGYLLDIADARFGRRRLQAVKLSLLLVALACPVTMVTAAARSRSLFFWSLALGQVLIFAATAPANIAMMEAVTPAQRGLALGLCTLASHLLGDLIPPVLVGYIADATGSLSAGMWLLVLWLWWSVVFWSMATVKTNAEEAARLLPVRRCFVEGPEAREANGDAERKT